MPRSARPVAAVAAGIALCLLLSVAAATAAAPTPTAAANPPSRTGGGASTGCRFSVGNATVAGGAAADHAAPAQTGEVTLSTTDGAGKARSYRVHLPAGYDPKQTHALIFVFHGANSSAAESSGWGLQDSGAAAREAIVVFPNGIAFQNYGVGWDDRSTGYDLPFFDHMLTSLESAYCVDTTRVFATGFSWGGDFAVALACNRGDELRAVAINSATDEFKDKADYRSYQDLPCRAQRPPALRFQHAATGDAAYPPPYFATTSRLLQALNSCSGATRPAATVAPGQSCVAYQGCRSDYVECSFDAHLGHVLPPNWARDTWNFFASQ